MEKIIEGILSSAIYGILGIILMGLGFLIVRVVTPFSIKKEIEVDQNTSLGLIIAAVIIGISIIIAAAIFSFENKVESNLQVSGSIERIETKSYDSAGKVIRTETKIYKAEAPAAKPAPAKDDKSK
ncbi:MAG TPA: DUF350 domain-containing protein [Spirochaetota bacterium]|nr:DUF350 domain-containing protein [Spirochaetota bacterium]HPH03662.1 DUF350 domain-containing protein [Spirochaetota bacterium]HPN83200.1 DUF350 domain-containing protein [Spirochaetota bacterium]